MVLNAPTQGPHKELMVNLLTNKSWSPYVVGTGIGILSWFAFVSADHPIGVTTAFEHTAALALKAVAPGIEQSNEYFAKQAAEGKPPKIDWEWRFFEMLLWEFFGLRALPFCWRCFVFSY